MSTLVTEFLSHDLSNLYNRYQHINVQAITICSNADFQVFNKWPHDRRDSTIDRGKTKKEPTSRRTSLTAQLVVNLLSTM